MFDSISSKMPSRRGTTYSDSSSSSGYSDSSDHSRSTAPTVYSVRPHLKHYQTAAPTYFADEAWDGSHFGDVEARSSVETYASTEASDEDLVEDCPPYEQPHYRQEAFTPTAIPSTPPDFAEFFPSTRRLCIRHDDSTLDGNMNLRIDTEVRTSGGRKVDLTLFHLRMHDLKTRDFSLRRYCRESGREVCHSSRNYTKPATERRPGLQRSMSNALSTLRTRSETKTATTSGLKRHDSGYDSTPEDEEDCEYRHVPSRVRSNIPLPTNTTKLEFSNYAHIDVKRRGAKTSKRYDFEYWGTAYAWKRVARRDGNTKEISYHLVNSETSAPVAYIVPTPLTTAEAREEEAKGGWVPPCSMWISDERILSGLTDVAE